MAVQRFTDDQKSQAVALYLESGATAAATETGCTRQAVYKWLAEYGVDSVNDEEKRAATVERHVAKRSALAEAFADVALALILSAEGAPPGDAQKLAVAAAISAEKHLLLSVGSAKGANVPPVITLEMVEAEVARLEEELAKAPRSKQQAEIDLEMERLIAEHHRSREAQAQIDEELGRSPAPPPWTYGRGRGPNGDWPPDDAA